MHAYMQLGLFLYVYGEAATVKNCEAILNLSAWLVYGEAATVKNCKAILNLSAWLHGMYTAKPRQ